MLCVGLGFGDGLMLESVSPSPRLVKKMYTLTMARSMLTHHYESDCNGPFNAHRGDGRSSKHGCEVQVPALKGRE